MEVFTPYLLPTLGVGAVKYFYELQSANAGVPKQPFAPGTRSERRCHAKPSDARPENYAVCAWPCRLAPTTKAHGAVMACGGRPVMGLSGVIRVFRRLDCGERRRQQRRGQWTKAKGGDAGTAAVELKMK